MVLCDRNYRGTVVLLLAGASYKPANEMTGIQKPPQRLLIIHLLYIDCFCPLSLPERAFCFLKKQYPPLRVTGYGTVGTVSSYKNDCSSQTAKKLAEFQSRQFKKSLHDQESTVEVLPGHFSTVVTKKRPPEDKKRPTHK